MQSHTWNNSIIHGEHVNLIFNLNFSFSLVVPINTRTFAVLSANELVMRAIESLWFPEKWTMTLISTFLCQQTVTMTVYWPFYMLLELLSVFPLLLILFSVVWLLAILPWKSTEKQNKINKNETFHRDLIQKY